MVEKYDNYENIKLVAEKQLALEKNTAKIPKQLLPMPNTDLSMVH